MKIVDQSENLNMAVNLKDVAAKSSGPIQGINILARGTVSAGTVKLTASQDGITFYPLKEDGVQVELEINSFTFLRFENIYVKCDLTGVTSSDLIVEVQ